MCSASISPQGCRSHLSFSSSPPVGQACAQDPSSQSVGPNWPELPVHEPDAPTLSHFPLCSHTRTPCFLACCLCQHGREAKGTASGPGCLGSNPGCTTDEFLNLTALSLPGRHIVGLSAEFIDSRCSALCPEHGAHPTDTTCYYFKAGGVVPSYPEPYVLLRLPVSPT